MKKQELERRIEKLEKDVAMLLSMVVVIDKYTPRREMLPLVSPLVNPDRPVFTRSQNTTKPTL